MIKIVSVFAVFFASAAISIAQEGGGYAVNDPARPKPVEITPGTSSTQDQPGKAPSDAIVLFDGKDLSKWKTEKGEAAPWMVGDGFFEIVPNSGSLVSRDEFGDCQ